MAVALERARAHHDVAARGGEAVQQHDRDPLAVLLPGERHAAGLHGDLGHRRHTGRRDLRRHGCHLPVRRRRALARAARRRRLLGRLVRPLPPAHADPREGRDQARRQGRARQGRHRRQPARVGRAPDPEHPLGEGLQGRQGRRRVHGRAARPAGRALPRRPRALRGGGARARRRRGLAAPRAGARARPRRRRRPARQGCSPPAASARRRWSCSRTSPAPSPPTGSPPGCASRTASRSCRTRSPRSTTARWSAAWTR